MGSTSLRKRVPTHAMENMKTYPGDELGLCDPKVALERGTGVPRRNAVGPVRASSGNLRIGVPSSKATVRPTFKNALIFVTSNSQNGWYKSSECLWSSTTEIRGRVTLNEDYEELKELFTDTLGVQTLTLQMAYDDLLEASSEATMDEIISKIWCLNALLPTDDTYVDPRPLLQKPIFPVLYPDGSRALRSTDTRFAIADPERLASRFRGKIKMLDFTQGEVRSLKVFLDWANLSHCYLSASVRELTSISGATTPCNLPPTRDLKRKAYAILWYVVCFQKLKNLRLISSAAIQCCGHVQKP